MRIFLQILLSFLPWFTSHANIQALKIKTEASEISFVTPQNSLQSHEITSALVPGLGQLSKAKRVKAILEELKGFTKGQWDELVARVRGGYAVAWKMIDELVDEAELAILVKDIKYLPGPQLSADIVKSFEGLKYTNRKLISNEKFYKYHGTDNRTGRKYAWYTNKKYSTESELRQKLAIRDDWGVKIEFVSEFDVPTGIWVSEGKAAAKGMGYPGQDYQAVILNTPDAWVIKTEKAFK